MASNQVYASNMALCSGYHVLNILMGYTFLVYIPNREKQDFWVAL